MAGLQRPPQARPGAGLHVPEGAHRALDPSLCREFVHRSWAVVQSSPLYSKQPGRLVQPPTSRVTLGTLTSP